jgi:hypothetical protein
MKLRIFLCGLVFATFFLAGVFSHSQTSGADSTNETTGTTSTVTPLKPLEPIRPLGPPGGGAARGNAPLKITTVQNSQVPQQFTEANTGKRIIFKFFRVQFKIMDPTVTSLDSAAVYLYNQKKELAGSLTDYNPAVKLSGSEERQSVLNYPNMLSVLTGLEKNRSYSLIFMYQHNTVQFKYAVAVLTAKDKVVAEAYPGSARLEDFQFDGKDKLVQ